MILLKCNFSEQKAALGALTLDIARETNNKVLIELATKVINLAILLKYTLLILKVLPNLSEFLYFEPEIHLYFYMMKSQKKLNTKIQTTLDILTPTGI